MNTNTFNIFNKYVNYLAEYNNETDRLFILMIRNIINIFIHICFILIRICVTLFQLYIIYNLIYYFGFMLVFIPLILGMYWNEHQ